MPWYSIKRNSLFTSIVLGVLLACLHFTGAGATDTSINAKVCGGNPDPKLRIAQPKSDSLVKNPAVTIRGTVKNASQVEVRIDGALNNVFGIGASQVAYSTDVQLSEGSHTVGLTAIGICSGEDTVELVVTYQPKAKPSQGSQVNTAVGGSSSDNNSSSVTEGIPTPSTETSDSIPAPNVPTVFQPYLGNISNDLGLQQTFDSGVLKGAARIVLVAAAGTIAVAAGALAPTLIAALPPVKSFYKHHKHHGRFIIGTTLRLFSVPLFLAAYFL